MDTPDLAPPRPLPLLLTPALPGASGVYLTGTEQLRVTCFNSLAAVTLAIEWRVLLPDGTVTRSADRLVPTTDRSSSSTLINLPEGWLLDVMVRATGATPRRGQCFVVLELVLGFGGSVQSIAFLTQGYVTDTSRVGFPRSLPQWSTEGPGVIRVITGTDPAANTELSDTVPTNARWRLRSYKVVFVTDATVTNRTFILILDDGTNDILRCPYSSSQAASLTRHYNGGDFGYASTADDNGVTLAIPSNIILMGGSRLRSTTRNLQAGDNYGAPQITVEEWIED
jgi:hypothetical protein